MLTAMTIACFTNDLLFLLFADLIFYFHMLNYIAAVILSLAFYCL